MRRVERDTVLRKNGFMREKINSRECFDNLGVVYENVSHAPLVSKKYFSDCIRKIYSNQHYCIGYDAMTLYPGGTVQPHLDYSASFNDRYKYGSAAEEVVRSILDDPQEVTHYDLVIGRLLADYG